MLLTDTNILRRICLGQARKHVNRLRERDIRLATTAHNIGELHRNLVGFGLVVEAVIRRVEDISRRHSTS